MPMLFISYKRGTAVVAPLKEKLRAAKYRIFFDTDSIHLGDSDFQVVIDQGLKDCAAVILCITPGACQSEAVRYEVKKAIELNKLIFPLICERMTKAEIDACLTTFGLSPNMQWADFTDADHWDENVAKLLNDLKHHKVVVTRHEVRATRGTAEHLHHQAYLKRLVEQVGRLRLSAISATQKDGAALEDVYVPMPTEWSLSTETKDYRITDWWLSAQKDGYPAESDEPDAQRLLRATRIRPQNYGWSEAPLTSLIDSLQADYAAWQEREKRWDRLEDGDHANEIRLMAEDIAAACDRLVILGGPGSGKSTFVKHLALCLAGAQLDGWSRPAGLAQLGSWTHDALTPVYVELRRLVSSAHFPQSITVMPSADTLWNYVVSDVLGADLAAYAADLQADLHDGRAVIILDGLDEVPYPRQKGGLAGRQEQLKALARSLTDRYSGSRIIVASRPYAYQGWTLPGFSDVRLIPFQQEERQALAAKLFRTAQPNVTEDEIESLTSAFEQAVTPLDDELKDTPLFITLMAALFQAGEQAGLPARKGALYRESILLLLERWTAQKPSTKTLTELLGNSSRDDLLARLAALAYDIHERFGDQPGTPEIPRELLYGHLFAMERDDETIRASQLVSYLSENAGVLVSPGQSTSAGQDVFHFAHRSFQEYLAAEHLADGCLTAKTYVKPRTLIQQRADLWRRPCVLLGDVLVYRKEDDRLWDYLDELLPDPVPETLAADDPRCWSAWLAAQIVEEQKPHEGRMGRGEKAIRDHLIGWWVKVIETAGVLNPPERAACGRALGLLGDPRPGVRLNADGLPDIAWSDPIPADTDGQTFTFGEGDEAQQIAIPYSYRIAKYPVTYAQYAAFVDSEDGYTNDMYWTEAGLKWRGSERHPEAFWNDPDWHIANHPVVGVTWYEAVAFCRWLSAKTGQEIRLPTEAEWEKVARGKDGLIYPYGNEFDAAQGNTAESQIGRTSAVGMFPGGASPYGALDMSGNVWEWCLMQGSPEYRYPEDYTPKGKAARVGRGGWWHGGRNSARAAARDLSRGDFRFNPRGFRVVWLVSSPI